MLGGTAGVKTSGAGYITPKKNYGQNFLKRVPRKFFKVLDDLHANTPAGQGSDYLLVFEVGPGTGMITSRLLQRLEQLLDAGKIRGFSVVLIELDKDLVALLQDKFAGYIQAGQVQIVNADAARFDYAQAVQDLTSQLSKVRGVTILTMGALPYNVSKRIIAKILTDAAGVLQLWQNKAGDISWHSTFITQHEVAKAYAAEKGEFLGLFLRLYAQKVRILQVLKPDWFWPKPKVHSAIFAFEHRNFADLDADVLNTLGKCIKYLFAHPRKTLRQTIKLQQKAFKDCVTKLTSMLGIKAGQTAAQNTLQQNQLELTNRLRDICQNFDTQEVLSKRAQDLSLEQAVCLCVSQA